MVLNLLANDRLEGRPLVSVVSSFYFILLFYFTSFYFVETVISVENSILYILETIQITAIVNRYKLAQVIPAETVKRDRISFLR